MDIVEQSEGQFHVLVIIADGQVEYNLYYHIYHANMHVQPLQEKYLWLGWKELKFDSSISTTIFLPKGHSILTSISIWY